MVDGAREVRRIAAEEAHNDAAWMVHWLHDWKGKRPKTPAELLRREVDVRDLGGLEGVKQAVRRRRKKKE